MNVLMQEWELPPFDKIDTEYFEPALTAALDEAKNNVEAIATNPEAATFGNTVEALERASHRLDRIGALMTNLNECCTSDALQQTALHMEPLITRFAMQVATDRRLFERVEAVRTTATGLSEEQRTLLENTHKSFLRHGVGLGDEERKRFRQIAEELSELQLCFNQNALADLNAWTMHTTHEADLDGLPEAIRQAAHEEAAARGKEGWLFTLAAPSYLPFMTYSTRRDLREKMYRAYGAIGNHGGEHDNNELIGRIVKLRAEQASLLGYDTYCDYVLEDRMVQSLPRLRRFMQELHDAVRPAAVRDLDDLTAIAGEAGIDDGVNPWDISYLSERLRRQRYSLDSEALRPYFPLEAVRKGIFDLYGRLYGLYFEEDRSIPVYHSDVKAYRVSQRHDPATEGTAMGVLYLDMFPRESKRSGAWMTEFRGQYGAVRPQIQVVCNFSKPTGDGPALLRFSEVETFMHEMGHAMHGMLSEVQYESLSGTNVKRDFVEMPSQVMENWCYEPEFLSTFARHYQTGETLPNEYVEKIRAAQNHMAGWLCLRQLNLGMTDIAFHTMEMKNGEPGCESSADAQRSIQSSQFKAEEVEAAAMDNLLPRVAGCCTATNFSHIFSGGYASGYYGYKWAEVLDADIFSRFKQEGIFNRRCADRFRREILSRGGTEHPAVLFRNFMGRDPDNQALLKRMNLL